MRTLATGLGVVTAALALAGGAGAKGMTAVQVCGPAACRELPRSALERFGADDRGAAIGTSPQAYYLLRFFMDEPGAAHREAFRGHYVRRGSALEAVGTGSEWQARIDLGASVLDATLRSLRPFPAPRLTRVQVGAHVSADPRAYEPLLGLPPAELLSLPTVDLALRLTWSGRNPWSGVTSLEFDRRTGLLYGPNGYFRVPRGLAVRLGREAAGLPPVPPAGGFGWVGVSAGAAATLLAVLAGSFLLLRRRRSLPRREPSPA